MSRLLILGAALSPDCSAVGIAFGYSPDAPRFKRAVPVETFVSDGWLEAERQRIEALDADVQRVVRDAMPRVEVVG